MNWASLHTLPVHTVTPDGYEHEQLRRDDIEAVVRNIRNWYPDISVGAAHGFVDASFYQRRVCLAGEPETDVIVYVCKRAGEIVSMTAIERDSTSATLQGRLAVVCPEHRNSGLARFGPFILDHQASAMGMALAYSRVSLKHVYAQRLVERAGFMLVGIMPASDREVVHPGVVRHVPEALYAKVYAPRNMQFFPADDCMTDEVRRMWHYLFESVGR
jgi:hypothetical protein